MGLSVQTLPWFKDKLEYHTHFMPKSQNKAQASNARLSYWGFIDAILRVTTLAQLIQVCQLIAKQYGYNHFGFAYVYPIGREKFACHHLFEGLSEWVAYYQKKLIFVDPFTDHCIKHSTPLAWRSLKQSNKALLQASPQVGAAFSDFSINNMLSVPYHGAGGVLGCFRLMCTQHHKLNKLDMQLGMAELHSLTAYAMDAGRNILCNQVASDDKEQAPHLTVREKQVLALIANGCSAYEISTAMKISENTVLTHTKNVYRKLGAKNRQVAVVRAVALGLVEI